MSELIPVAILGATGAVGQKMVELLVDHPFFKISALCASSESAGKPYGSFWRMKSPLPQHIASMIVQECTLDVNAEYLFSALDSSVAGTYEKQYAEAGYTVISNSRNHRMDPHVPLLIPEVNADHLDLLDFQTTKGKIITNPNCVVAGLALALKPLADAFGIRTVSVTTMQAISGAGFAGAGDIEDNVIPFIKDEEGKVELEPKKILGKLNGDSINFHNMTISAQCNRVPVADGHTACVSIQFNRPVESNEIINAWKNFPSLELESAPNPVFVIKEDAPQPKHDRMNGKGMAITIGRLRPCPLGGWKFVALVHNTIRGAAGASILNAELLHARRSLSLSK